MKMFQRQNITFDLTYGKLRKRAHILLKNQLSAQECWKCKIEGGKGGQDYISRKINGFFHNSQEINLVKN